MSGSRPNNPRVGDRAEYYANFLLSRIATAVQVPRQEDFGIDFIGALLRRDGQSLREGPRFNVQVKSNADLLEKPFGGPRKGTWPHHEVQWLLGREPYPAALTSLFVGVVDLEAGSLDLYHTVNMFHARWMAGYPAEVVLAPGQLEGGAPLEYAFAVDLPYPPDVVATAPGDKKRWMVRLREPIARLTGPMVGGSDDDVAPVVATLERWIRIDQLNRIAAFLRVPCGWYLDSWRPNVPPDLGQLRPAVYQGEGGVEDLSRMQEVLHPLFVGLLATYSAAGDAEGMSAVAPSAALLARRVARS